MTGGAPEQDGVTADADIKETDGDAVTPGTLGMVGLGRMGGNMAERLRRGGHTVIGYDRAPDSRDVDSLEALVDGACPAHGWSG